MHKRIVSLLPSFTKIICKLLYRESLIGISHECYYPISISGIPVISTIYLYSKDARIFVLTSKGYLYAMIAGIHWYYRNRILYSVKSNKYKWGLKR